VPLGQVELCWHEHARRQLPMWTWSNVVLLEARASHPTSRQERLLAVFGNDKQAGDGDPMNTRLGTCTQLASPAVHRQFSRPPKRLRVTRRSEMKLVGAENLIRRGHAAKSYSWMSPPSRSDLRMRLESGNGIGTGVGPRGDAWSSDRCGRWQL